MFRALGRRAVVRACQPRTTAVCGAAALAGSWCSRPAWSEERCDSVFARRAPKTEEPKEGRSMMKQASAFVAKEIKMIEEEVEELVEEVEEHLVEDLEEYVVHPLRDGFARFAPYAKYLAYSSDIGESFRTVASVNAVNMTYYLAFAYCAADIGYNGYLEHQKSDGDMARTCMTLAHSTVFQGLASLLIPFVVIHNAVHQSDHRFFSKQASPFVRQWGPSAVALCIIPFLPIVDEPVEQLVDYVFDHCVPHKAENQRIKDKNTRVEEKKGAATV